MATRAWTSARTATAAAAPKTLAYAGWIRGPLVQPGPVGPGPSTARTSAARCCWATHGSRCRPATTAATARPTARAGCASAGVATQVTPFVDVDYVRLNRNGFAEQGAYGFGLQVGRAAPGPLAGRRGPACGASPGPGRRPLAGLQRPRAVAAHAGRARRRVRRQLRGRARLAAAGRHGPVALRARLARRGPGRAPGPQQSSLKFGYDVPDRPAREGQAGDGAATAWRSDEAGQVPFRRPGMRPARKRVGAAGAVLDIARRVGMEDPDGSDEDCRQRGSVWRRERGFDHRFCAVFETASMAGRPVI